MGTPVTMQEKEKILDLYVTHRSMNVVAGLSGRSYGTVNRLIHESSLSIRTRGAEKGERRNWNNVRGGERLTEKRPTGEHYMKEPMRQEIVDDYVKSGMSIREIAAKHKRSYGCIHGTLTNAKVQMRTWGGKKNKKK